MNQIIKTTLQEKIYDFCLESKETNPFILYNQIVNFTEVPMHGPIHHFIIPAVLFTIYHNIINSDLDVKRKNLDISIERSNLVPAGFCTNFGSCGAGLGVGIFFSVITNNSALSVNTWSNVITITSEIELLIAKNGGPRCCKRDSYLSLIKAVNVLNKQQNLNLNYNTEIKCAFSKKNPHCRLNNCLFYKNNVHKIS